MFNTLKEDDSDSGLGMQLRIDSQYGNFVLSLSKEIFTFQHRADGGTWRTIRGV